jgi:hypothetical protein
MQNSPLGPAFICTDIKVDSFTIHQLNIRIEKVLTSKYSDAKVGFTQFQQIQPLKKIQYEPYNSIDNINIKYYGVPVSQY